MVGAACRPELIAVWRADVVTVIVNSAAGGTRGPALLDQLRGVFQAAQLAADIQMPATAAAAAHAARTAVGRGAGVVVAAGGDGTLNIVASALAGSETALGVLPLGTLNHFAKDLGVPVDIEKAVAIIAAGRVAAVDLGEVNGRLFVNNASIGIYPNIVVEREMLRRRGHRKWPAHAMATVRILRMYPGMRMRVISGGSSRDLLTPFLFVGNNEYEAEGFSLGARRRLDAGSLYAYLAPRQRVRDLPRLAALALAGRARRSGAFERFAAEELRVELRRARRVRVAIDGEVVEMSPPLVFRTRQRALRVIAPGE